ncbi:hypothetical protein [Bacteroides reticulotermitis]
MYRSIRLKAGAEMCVFCFQSFQFVWQSACVSLNNAANFGWKVADSAFSSFSRNGLSDSLLPLKLKAERQIRKLGFLAVSARNFQKVCSMGWLIIKIVVSQSVAIELAPVGILSVAPGIWTTALGNWVKSPGHLSESLGH